LFLARSRRSVTGWQSRIPTVFGHAIGRRAELGFGVRPTGQIRGSVLEIEGCPIALLAFRV
jgi:hypothetical protein